MITVDDVISDASFSYTWVGVSPDDAHVVATAIDALKQEIEAGGERAPVAARALQLLYRLHRASQASAGSAP